MDVKLEFIKKMQNEIGIDKTLSLLNSFNMPKTSGFIFNLKKLNNNFSVLEKLKSKYHLKEKYILENYIYYFFDKDKYDMLNIKLSKEPIYHAGLIYIQEPSANEVIYNLKINPDDKILDLCSSPGGKAIQCLMQLNEKGFIIANEINESRCKILSSNIERMGFDNVYVTSNDVKVLKKLYNNYFDKIIIDAPCSNEGIFRKNNEAVNNWNINLVKNCSKIQKELIVNSIKMLKVGGILSYSTCTYSKEEDEDNVDFIINNFKNMKNIYKKKIFTFDNIGEGQFMAFFEKIDVDGDEEKDISDLPKQKYSFEKEITKNELKLYKDFEKEYLKDTLINEEYMLIKKGEYLYRINRNVNLEYLNVKRPGLLIGKFEKNRFEVEHSLSHFIKSDNFKNVINLDDELIEKYLKGETFKINANNGYNLICYNGLNIGFVKVVNNSIKNHYPKGLRN